MRYAALLPLLASAALLLASCGDSSSSSDDHLSSSGDASSSGSGDGANPSVAIAPWPGTAVAAYTLIADDFCGGLAGQAHADTMMANRGMGMAFGAMVASCSDGDWALARERIGRGHEIINHSWSHMCATTVERCGSGPTYGPELFEQEFGQSTQGIEQNAGVRPTFFIFPYDESTDTARAYLKGLGYLGARAGEKLKLNGDVFDPFRPNFDVNWPEGQKEGMQQWGFVTGLTDALIAQGHGWGIREIHGVNDGWGPIALDSMRAHADELKRLVDAGKLWVAPPSEVIRYHDQREHRRGDRAGGRHDRLSRPRLPGRDRHGLPDRPDGRAARRALRRASAHAGRHGPPAEGRGRGRGTGRQERHDPEGDPRLRHPRRRPRARGVRDVGPGPPVARLGALRHAARGVHARRRTDDDPRNVPLLRELGRGASRGAGPTAARAPARQRISRSRTSIPEPFRASAIFPTSVSPKW